MHRRPPAAWLSAVAAAFLAAPAAAGTLSGLAMTDTRMALPEGVTFEAVIEDISRAGAPAEVLARVVLADPGQPPIAFALDYDPADLRPGAIYALRATIRRGEVLMFTTDTITRVLDGAAAEPVELRLRGVGG